MSIDAQKDIELFDKIASKYAKKDYTISTKIIREYKVISSLDLLDNIGEIKTIVEIGCGIAAPYNYLPKYINFDKYIGLDHSSEMIENAKKLHKNDKRISFECTDIKEYDKFNEADLVIALGVLHHVTDVDNFLKILYEQIGENTQVLFFEPISTNKLIGFVRDIRKKIDNTYSSEQVFFEPEELFNLMKTNGFKNINFKYKGYLSSPFGEVILKPIWLFHIVSKITLFVDKLIEKYFPESWKKYSWGIAVSATK